jgi:hypothetical protein
VIYGLLIEIRGLQQASKNVNANQFRLRWRMLDFSKELIEVAKNCRSNEFVLLF